jgi:hypothetical protein
MTATLILTYPHVNAENRYRYWSTQFGCRPFLALDLLRIARRERYNIQDDDEEGEE